MDIKSHNTFAHKINSREKTPFWKIDGQHPPFWVNFFFEDFCEEQCISKIALYNISTLSFVLSLQFARN